MVRQIRSRTLLYIAMLLLLFQCEQSLCCGQSNLVDEIVVRWQGRSDRVQTLRAVWSEVTTQSEKDSDGSSLPLFTRLTLGQSGETLLEGLDGLEGENRILASSFNGGKNFNFTRADGDQDWPRGIVWSDRHNDEIHNIQMRPWLLHYRPFSIPVPALSPDGMRVRAEDVVLNGHRCAVVEMQYDVSPLGGMYWLDLDRAFLVLRYNETVNNKTTMELNIDYREEPEIGWVPSTWNAAFTNGSYSVSGKLHSFEANPKISRTDFDLEFPKGTVVFDRDAGIRSLILENGSQRIITPEESASGFTYEELKATKSGELARRPPAFPATGWRAIFMLINLAAILAVILYWIRTKKLSSM